MIDSTGPLTFSTPDGGRFRLSLSVLTKISRYVQNTPRRHEAGGVLLGRHVILSKDIVVDDLTVPMRGDRRTRYSFHRAQKSHQAAIERAWLKSNGTCTYLGEWHTHPEPSPSPSAVDISNWIRKLSTDQFTDRLFFVIKGTEQVKAWQGRHFTKEIDALEVVTSNVTY